MFGCCKSEMLWVLLDVYSAFQRIDKNGDVEDDKAESGELSGLDRFHQPLFMRLSRKAHSHVVHGVVEVEKLLAARFNGLKDWLA